ncbi:MAG: helix-turn-helix domain-containing protein [Blastocatellia bacterium]
MPFTVPPLRDRPDDILPLARHFLALHCERMSRPAPSLTAEAEAALLRYRWPGNVRELENVIERALAFGQGEKIKVESLIFQATSKIQPAAGWKHPDLSENDEAFIPAGVRFDDLALAEKRELVERALRQCRGNRERAAALLGLPSRHRLYRLMKKLDIA